MAPKKKTKKQDDWESEIGEEPDPIAAATQDAKETDTAAEPDAAEQGGGGLLAALKKNKSNKKKKGKHVEEDYVDGEDPPTENGVNGHVEPNGIADLAAKAPEEATTDDLFAEQITKTKGAKGKQGKNEGTLQPNETGEAEGEDGGTVKSKKEKEKEKKERERQRKKEQAALKKKSTPAPVPREETVKPVEEATPEPTPAADAGKGKKKVPAALLALQKQQEALRRQQEEKAKADAEEWARIEEAERLEAEEEKKKEDARARKKEKEKEKKEQLKKEGKLLTPAQREANRRNELKREQMLKSGAVVAGLGEEGAEKKKPVYDSKKKKGLKKPGDDAKAQEEKEAAQAEARRQAEDAERRRLEEEKAKAEAAAAAAEPESDELEDWDAVSDTGETDVKESWDAASEDEEEHTKKSSQPPRKSVPPILNGTKDPTTPQIDLPSRSAQRPQQKTDSRVSRSDSDSDSDSDDSSADEKGTATQRAAAQKKAEAAARRKQQHEEALAARSKDNLRSPICCILGHVDTGKTKILDKIRQTNVQEGEAGGITQQIGATYFPVDALKMKTEVVNKDGAFEFKVPGLLVIDTPGHESFTNLRSRGSSLCNIAILVVDIMHGLEPQTLESMRLLRDRKTPFIVALNKIDRLYGWKKIDNNGFQESISLQNKGVQAEFRDRLEKTKVAFAEQGFNSELYSENKSMAKFVSLVPTSAHTGEGIPDLLKLLVSLTQERMTNKLMYLSEVECTVLEVKVIEGLGTTIDVVLSNGVLQEGDRIVLCGLNGAITTNIRALLTPAPLKELRLKSQYVHNQECKASLGVKIAANDLEHAIAGSRLLVVGPGDDEEDLEEEVMSDIENLLQRVSKTGRGVSVQASTLGSLEALLEFLKVSKIPVANISIGPVYKRDVMSAGIMLEKAKEYAVMLCFDVKVDKEAQSYADDQGIKIFTADIIYHLFDDFTKHMAQLAAQKKEDTKLLAVFPCVLAPVQVFHQKDPIVIGVDVTEGNLKLLTPIAAVRNNPVTNVKEVINLGRVTSIEREHKQIPMVKKGQPSVAIKIEGPNQPMYGRQLEEKDTLYSLISRASIDTLKEYYRSDVSNDEWALIKKLKGLFDIP
ncbi:translation initiation factor 5B, partial [Lecanoromycetidae sp. Uapishka_2]